MSSPLCVVSWPVPPTPPRPSPPRMRAEAPRAGAKAAGLILPGRFGSPASSTSRSNQGSLASPVASLPEWPRAQVLVDDAYHYAISILSRHLTFCFWVNQARSVFCDAGPSAHKLIVRWDLPGEPDTASALPQCLRGGRLHRAGRPLRRPRPPIAKLLRFLPQPPTTTRWP